MTKDTRDIHHHSPLMSDEDLVLRALRGLPSLTLPAARDRHIQNRATACFLETATRHQRLLHRAARVARPILPWSLAGLALGYLLWAMHTAAMFLP